MAKNCHTCKHLEWHDDDTDGFLGPNSGYGCGKRDPGTPAVECTMLANLAREDYRNRYKRCFEPRPSPAPSSGEKRSEE